MAVYYPVTPNGRHDSQHHGQWQSPSAYQGLVTYQHPPYHSPSTMAQQPPLRPQSTAPQQPLHPHHWQQQLFKYEAERSFLTPHARAQTNAYTMRGATKQAIPITNPNMHKTQGSISDRTDGSADDPPREGTPSGLGHPSSVAAPVAASPPVAPRPTATRPKDEALWTTLDMGGMRLKNLSSSVFRLTYLTTLYANHNNLHSLSPHISLLRNLVHLDISNNYLTSLPPDLGMLTNLKELLAFDNALETLPPQLGTLHQLVMFGLEGNPLQPNLRAILQKDGTPALIAFLRDSCPVPVPPPERLWKALSPHARHGSDPDPTQENFTLLCYNILCERYATSTMYGYTPSWALAWDYRKELILTEILNYEADFLCLQEVDAAQYEDYFTRHLEPQGYGGIFASKSRARTMTEAQRRLVDGCAIFYKKDKFVLVEHQLIEFNSASQHSTDQRFSDDFYNRVFTKDQIAIVALLENRSTGSRLIIANVHVYWDPEFRDVKLVQVGIMMEELERIAKRFASLPPRLLDGQHGPTGPLNGKTNGTANGSATSSPSTPEPPEQLTPAVVRKAPRYDEGTRIPTIVCGDFNSIPMSGVYEYLLNGSLSPNHEDFMNHKYGRYTDENGGMKHAYSLKSAYATALGGSELPITNYTPSFKGVIDYVWYSNLSLSVEAVLGEVDEKYLEKVVGFPNAHFPSDHVCILAEFKVLKQKEAKEPTGGASRPAAFTNGRASNTRK